MKPLFDQNLSRQLPRRLADLYPDSLHVLHIRLDEVADTSIRDYARHLDYIIYRTLNRTLGPPPKVALITSGNGPAAEVENLLCGKATLL